MNKCFPLGFDRNSCFVLLCLGVFDSFLSFFQALPKAYDFVLSL